MHGGLSSGTARPARAAGTFAAAGLSTRAATPPRAYTRPGSLPRQASMKRILYAAVAVAALCLTGAALWSGGASAAPASTFVLLDGSQKTTQDLRGKVALVNFWATSCVTCVAEMPQIMSTYDKYKARGFETVAVAMHYDPPSYVVNYAETRKLPFKVAIDNTGTIAKAWGDVQLTPTTYVLNKRGDIVKTYVGQPDFAELHRLIEKLLAEA